MAARGARGAREVPAHIMGPRIILLLTTLALLLLGFVMVYSTSSVIALSTGDPAEVNPMADMVGQVKYAAVGIVLAIILWKFIPYTLWKSNAVWIVWGVAFVLLLATAFMGCLLYTSLGRRSDIVFTKVMSRCWR